MSNIAEKRSVDCEMKAMKKLKPAKNERSIVTSELLESVYERLVPLWPDAHPLLHYQNCFQLLISVILSAQTTDEQVNMVTGELFARYPDAHSLSVAVTSEVEQIIRPVGFFHIKSLHIIQTAKTLVEKFGGQIPPTFAQMLELPGVGRKTANLVASACHNIPGIIVDTHVVRVLFRLGIAPEKNAKIAESVVRQHLEPEKHTQFSYSVNRHGKFTCTARNPACKHGYGVCPLDDLCPKIGVAS